jgi:hypothetical protein
VHPDRGFHRNNAPRDTIVSHGTCAVSFVACFVALAKKSHGAWPRS